MQVRAILFDTQSIQRYIFSNNRLKTNIGASYIVSHVFEDVLLGEILQPGKFGLQTVDDESWKLDKDVPEDLTADCYVAYIGGGNALLLFPDQGVDYRKEIVSAFTERLLIKYPGLKTGAALGMLRLDPPEDFQASMKELYGELKNNQFSLFPLVNVMNTGLTLSCEVNGEVANAFVTNGEVANAFVTNGSLVKNGSPRFFSQEVVAKAEAADKADKVLQDEFKEVLGKYAFPKELDRLGQKETENDIAVVHIDGNNMGSRFSNCASLAARSKLSKQVADNTKTAFKQLLQHMVATYDSYSQFLELSDYVLPIRPLILGGDDITFVCNAKLALLYTKKFMEYLMDDSSGRLAIDSCAGIAIVSTSYPFFRAYELAEQLCDEAKKISRKTPGTSWLDYAILHGEQAPTIEQIRAQEYKGTLGDMHFGPYQVGGTANHHYNIDKLLQAADEIKNLPPNKYKELRSVLQHTEHDIKRFVEQLHHNGLDLPMVPGWEMYKDNLWDKTSGTYKTPFIDAIEIIDYIPPKEAR